MISVDEARRAIESRARPPAPRAVALADALGCPLAEPAVADLDLPPFDKALMDGYAVRASDCEGPGPHRLAVGEEIVAGRTPSRPLDAGEAAAIMTGAPLPPGADAVVMHERTRLLPDGRVEFSGPVAPGLARLERGREMRAGQVLFERGTALNAVRLGVLAGVGIDPVWVIPRPRVAILPTGDELVPPTARPGPGQIRETNSTVLAALTRSAGGVPHVHPIAPDEPGRLRDRLGEALDDKPDILLLCGGVSAGKRDLVPAALEAAGVETVFHKVRLKPGKPLLFGTRAIAEVSPLAALSCDPSVEGRGRTSNGDPCAYVFGLPGNPVSVVVGFLLFVMPLIHQLRGDEEAWDEPGTKRLARPFRHRGDRPTYHPAAYCFDAGMAGSARPLDWAGSADLFAVAQAHGFLAFPEGDRDHEAGDSVPFLPLPILPI